MPKPDRGGSSCNNKHQACPTADAAWRCRVRQCRRRVLLREWRRALVPGIAVPELCRRLGAAADLQFLQDVMHVVLHGRVADPKQTCDFFVAAALVRQYEDLVLATCELADGA